MHAHFFGHFLDHHGLQSVRAVIEKIALARDDGLADAQNGVFALLDIFHQLDRGGEAFLHVVAHVAVGGIAGQQAAIGGAQAQLRHVVFVDEDTAIRSSTLRNYTSGSTRRGSVLL